MYSSLTADIINFQSRVAKPFFTSLKDQFNSQDAVSSFSIFDPKKIPNPPIDHSTYGEESIEPSPSTGRELPAELVVSVEFAKPPFISSNRQMEWITLRKYITNHPKEI